MNGYQRSLRIHHIFSTGFRNRAVGSSTRPRNLINDNKMKIGKKRISSYRYALVQGGKLHKKNRFRSCMESVEKKWNASSCKFDRNGTCKIMTPDERFELTVSGPTPDATLSISTCIYTCASDVRPTSVERKAKEMNTFLEISGDEDYKFALEIDPKNGSNITSPRQPQRCRPIPVKIILSLSCSMNGYFNLDYKTKDNDDDTDEKVHVIINEFVETALSFQTQLENADEKRLGMVPRPKDPKVSIAINTPHIELLANPPSIVTQLMSEKVNTTTFLPKTSSSTSKSSVLVDPANVSLISSSTATSIHIHPKAPTRRRSLTRDLRSKSSRKLQEALRKAHTSKSARNILSQFSTPEEARVFELYSRQKSKQRAANKHTMRDTSLHGRAEPTEATDVSDESFSIASSGRILKRTASLPGAFGKRNSMVSPKPPERIDWNKTPIISNKKSLARVPNELC